MAKNIGYNTIEFWQADNGISSGEPKGYISRIEDIWHSYYIFWENRWANQYGKINHNWLKNKEANKAYAIWDAAIVKLLK